MKNNTDDLAERVLAANIDLVNHGLVVLTWGNASAINRDQHIVAIKPSGVPYSELSTNDISIVDFNGHLISGRKPSSDTPTHLELYASFPTIGGIVHTHSTYATILAQALQPIECIGTTHADYFNGTIPVTRVMNPDEIAQDYERNTGRVIVETFRNGDIDYDQICACLVASHGPFVWALTLDAAVENAVVLEQVARLYYHSRMVQLSTCPISQELLRKHFTRKHGPTRYYGQREEHQ